MQNQEALFEAAPPGTAGILPAAVGRQDAGGPRGYASLQSNLSEKTLADEHAGDGGVGEIGQCRGQERAQSVARHVAAPLRREAAQRADLDGD